MSQIKRIIFSDLDGTLLDHYTYQSIAASETLAQLKSADIPVILNTSKTYAELETIIQDLQLDTPFIIENGAAVYIPIGTFASQPDDTKVVGKYWVKSFCLPVAHWLSLLSTEGKKFSGNFQGFSAMSESELALLTGLSIEDAERAKQRQYGEPIQWLGDEETKDVFINHMIDLGANVVQGGRFLHLGGYCDKGQAMLWLAEQYLEHYIACSSAANQSHVVTPSLCTIALGDGENDTAMLEAADIAVQIKSPVHDFPSLHRQKMTTQTSLYGPEGWAEAIQSLLVEQLT
ncbi:HAD-IIB family hydrolase [Colwellia sp. E2M01]|uniref:HAD-IIB family hydrolase n=1 Tax=Colwellia sp. E2M01 TaxID=2841561 RepID=UPI001C09BEAB|nr:HAD-IIB family hydrolase [Colwellia sp. E2M01]MBU2870643.1 HAD-IIB family hydrolase [Colwellia sp. E2M01]